MQQTRDIKNRIASVKKTQQITRAMKMISGVKFRKLEKDLVSSRPYTEALIKMVKNVIDRNKIIDDFLFVKKGEKTGKQLLVLFAGERGLCGSYNSSILKISQDIIKSHKNMDLFIVGKKGNAFYANKDVNIVKWINSNPKEFDTDNIESLKAELLEIYPSYDRIYFLYTLFKSALAREVVYEQVLPIKKKQDKAAEGIVVDYLYELTEENFLQELGQAFVTTKLKQSLFESVTSEESARMTAMDSATKNADDMIAKLTLLYNRARQAGITTEILEISGGAEALKNG